MNVRRTLVQPETIQRVIDDAVRTDKLMLKGAPTENDIWKDTCYIHDTKITTHVFTIFMGKFVHYYTYKDGRDIVEGVPEGGECYAIMARHYWQPEKLWTPEDIDVSASPLLGYNPQYNGTRQQAISYDLNSAYGAVILNGWIDTSKMTLNSIVEEGEIGFSADLSEIIEPGEFAIWKFPKVPTPPELVRFINVYYERKKKATTLKEKMTAKNMLNHVVGCLQNKNIFLRAYVVASCNKYILDRIDENTLYYNTDCIVSRVRRPDLEENLGPEIGQWKIDHEGLFAYRDFTYQWDFEKPAWRSVPKAYIPEHYDILTSQIDFVETNVWYMDWDNITFKKKEGL